MTAFFPHFQSYKCVSVLPGCMSLRYSRASIMIELRHSDIRHFCIEGYRHPWNGRTAICGCTGLILFRNLASRSTPLGVISSACVCRGFTTFHAAPIQPSVVTQRTMFREDNAAQWREGRDCPDLLSDNSNQITRVKKTTFLGIMIDEQLNWKEQIHQVQTGLSRITGVMYRASHVLGTASLLTLYHSLFLPIIV